MQVGAVIGSEAELVERYQISRAVFRESVRLLEHLGIASTRRGPGGGLVVAEPSTAAVTQAFIVYLTYTGLSLDDLFEARQLLECTTVRLAAERADENQIRALRDSVAAYRSGEVLDADAHHMLHTVIAHVARNPAGELFTDVLGRLTARWTYPSQSIEEQHQALDAAAQAHERIVEAITVGDAGRAEWLMAAHLDALGDWLGRHRDSPKSLDWALDESNGDDKLGTQVARKIIVGIVDRDWPVGEVLGSETELIERFDVSRSALREAVRLIEYHEVATMKSGPGGGLVVSAPGIGPIVRAATVYLRHSGIVSSDLLVLRHDLESKALALAADRATPDDIERLRAAATADVDAGFRSPLNEELHVNVADLAGNTALSLFIRVLVELTRVHANIPGWRSVRRSEINDETERAHNAIVDAVEQGDVALAQRRLGKHLAAMEPLLG